MSLFTEEPLAKTDLEKAEDAKRQIVTQSQSTLNRLVSGQRRAFQILWYNPLGPQAILDAFGTSAVELFVVSQKTEDFIKELKPDYEPLEVPYEFTINQDGTVTVGDKKEGFDSPFDMI